MSSSPASKSLSLSQWPTQVSATARYSILSARLLTAMTGSSWRKARPSVGLATK